MTKNKKAQKIDIGKQIHDVNLKGMDKMFQKHKGKKDGIDSK